MRRTAPQLLAGVVVVLLLLPIAAAAQMTMRPTPVPVVTAENTSWYLAGEPIMYSGSIYYPAGPEIYFNPYEMVRSGEFRGVPFYSRTTIEPFSKVFVPLPGGRMLPYERRRAGDLAGTTGSTAPSFPVVNPSEEVLDPTTYGIPQAAVSPTMLTQMIESDLPISSGVVRAPVATSGVAYEPPRGPLVTAYSSPTVTNNGSAAARPSCWIRRTSAASVTSMDSRCLRVRETRTPFTFLSLHRQRR